MKISVEKQSTNANTFRTPLEKIDSMREAPQVGKSMILESSTFESGGIMTSKVLELDVTVDGFRVQTLHSIYFIKVIKE